MKTVEEGDKSLNGCRPQKRKVGGRGWQGRKQRLVENLEGNIGTTSGEAQGLVLSWGGHLKGWKSEWEILGHEKLFLLLESDCQQGKKK